MTNPTETTPGPVAGRKGDTVPLDVWRVLIDPATGRETGALRRERMRTLGEVFADLYKAIDVMVCEKCGHERPRKSCEYSGTHGKKCGGQYRCFLDEYFHGPLRGDEHKPVPEDIHNIACYAVTGGNEGHYVHVEFRCFVDYRHDRPKDGYLNARVVRLACGKTFRGMAHAREIARRCADALGA